MPVEIKLIISDFDGTLVDTREANYMAYRDALGAVGHGLSPEKYDECFGLRFEEFMLRLGIVNPALRKTIQDGKANAYPAYFPRIKINRVLADFIAGFRRSGGHTAIASTARRQNLVNLLKFANLNDLFEIIVSGEEVARPKPDPECYRIAMARLSVRPEECLIFEDTDIGVQAAAASGASYMVIKGCFYGN